MFDPQGKLLQLIEVHTYYGLSHILQGISLSVARGSVVSLLGRNGAGKTTTLRTIVGLVKPNSGRVFFDGEEITGLRADLIARRGVATVPEERDIFTHLSVQENLEIVPARHQDWSLERIYATFPLLQPLKNRRGGYLSGGEQQTLAIARAMMIGPKILLLDEPSQGLAPIIVKRVLEILRGLKSQGMSILLIEQKLDIALDLSDYVYFIDQGHIVFEGLATEIKQRPELVREHLGVGV
jgi:branched-chain amino acid transport system ATP-binding protein